MKVFLMAINPIPYLSTRLLIEQTMSKTPYKPKKSCIRKRQEKNRSYHVSGINQCYHPCLQC